MICRSCWKVVTNGKCACWPESPSPGKQGIPQQPAQAEVVQVDAPDPDEDVAMKAMRRAMINALEVYWLVACPAGQSMEPSPKVEPKPPEPTMADQVRGMVMKNLSGHLEPNKC